MNQYQVKKLILIHVEILRKRGYISFFVAETLGNTVK